MSLFIDFWHAIVATLASVDLITLAIMLVIMLAAGLIMEAFGALLTTTVVALALFAVAICVRLVVTGGGHDAAALAAHQWHGFLGLTMQTLLVYALVFAFGIAIIHGLRQVVNARR